MRLYKTFGIVGKSLYMLCTVQRIHSNILKVYKYLNQAAKLVSWQHIAGEEEEERVCVCGRAECKAGKHKKRTST